jgi:Mn2+/Fe2+ NRAMP family transporter
MVMAGAMVVGLILDFAGLDAVKMLFWSAIVNGALAPPLVVLVVLLTSDKSVMGTRTNSRGDRSPSRRSLQHGPPRDTL